jgi:hypothetical protein
MNNIHDLESADYTIASAWASSPLGDPAAKDDYLSDEFPPDLSAPAAKQWSVRKSFVVAAVLLGAVGGVAALGLAIIDATHSSQPKPVSVVPGRGATITPQAPAGPPGSPPPSGAPENGPIPVAAPGSSAGPAVPQAPVVVTATRAPESPPAGSAPDNPPADSGPASPPDSDASAPTDPGSPPIGGPTVIVNVPPLTLPSLMPPPPPPPHPGTGRPGGNSGVIGSLGPDSVIQPGVGTPGGSQQGNGKH